jgi:integrase
VENKEVLIPLPVIQGEDMLGAEPFTPETEKQLIEYFSKRRYAERNIAILQLGIQTGFRISEILCLKRRDIIKSGNMVDRVHVRKLYMKGGMSEKNSNIHGRAMLITKETKKVLRTLLDWLDAHGYTDPDDFIFQTQRSGNQRLDKNGFWRQLWEAKKALGWTWKLSTHSMRKTFADRVYTNLMEKGNADGLRILQAGLGHANINNTIKYLAFKDDELTDAIHDVFGE